MPLAERDYMRAPERPPSTPRRQRDILRWRPAAYLWAAASPLILAAGDVIVGLCGVVLLALAVLEYLPRRRSRTPADLCQPERPLS